VEIEASGSVYAVRKVIDLHESCDVLAVADYRLIKYYMYPKYASWVVGFASNELVLAYTGKSKYADVINQSNWYEVLMEKDVKYGFANPNRDPCGYRAVGVLALASIYYGNMSIFEKLVCGKSNIYYEVFNGTFNVYVPEILNVNSSNLVVRHKSVELIALLEAGSIDYAFEYKSVAIQHHLKYIELPSEINLGHSKYDNYYSHVIVHILAGSSKEKAIKMQAIIYGVTIPVNAKHTRYALKFVKLLLSSKGKQIFAESGQVFLRKYIIFGNVPRDLIHG